ncbi:hypothetical protein Gpo141_00000706 [Globisporangium polare]
MRRRMYSPDRLLALHEYCQSTSRLRVFLVPILYCLPALIIMIIFDALPLRDPSEGWRANGVYWFRFGGGGAIMTGAILVQIQLVVPEIVFTRVQFAVIIIGVSFGCTVSLLLLAAYWKFPVPFTYTLGGVPLTATLSALVVATLGTANRARLKKYFDFVNTLGIQVLVLSVYPAYNAVFSSLEGNARLAFVLLLPIIKHTLKHVTKKVGRDLDEKLIATIASVDIFDALYMTKCMQSAGTLVVGAGIIAIDMVENFVMIQRLDRQTQTLTATKNYTERRDSNRVSPELLPWVAEVLVRKGECKRLTSPAHKAQVVPAQCQPEQQELQQNELTRATSVLPQASSRLAVLTRVVVPFTPPGPVRISRDAPSISILELASKEAATETLQLLYTSESVVIVEYVETVVPVVYVIYISILHQLPSAKYYTDMEGFTDEKLHSVATNILIYAFMELLSLLYVHCMLKRRFGISVFYQLAFALESEWPIYQAEFVTWILVVFQFLLVHSGADFTFQFDWDPKRAPTPN